MQNCSRLRTRVMLASIGMVVAACTSVHQTYVPDGRRGFVITCGGMMDSWSSCLIKAGRACGNSGYETIKGTEEDRAILIACKLPNAPAAGDPTRH